MECEPQIIKSQYSSFQAYCFKKADYDLIRSHLETIRFDALLATENVDEMLLNFYNILYETFDQFVPRATIRPTKNPPWFTSELVNLKNRKNWAHKKLCMRQKTDSNADESKYNQINEIYTNRHKELHEKYIKDLADNFKRDPKNFWTFVNGHRSTCTLPCKLNYKDKSATSNKDKADLFAEHFSSVYVKGQNVDDISEFIDSRADNNTFNIRFSPEQIMFILKTMDLNKGQGPDKIPPKFLRECNEILASPLCKIFNKSIQIGHFPEMFKICSISPIFKSGKKSDIINYRGVSIMCNIAKVFDKAVHDQLKMIISPNLSKKQHGFVSSRCIESNLMEFCTFTHESFAKNCQVDVFYADIKKAFDTVDHSILIKKLAKFRIGNETLNWLSSYSAGRKQFVKVGSSTSETFDAYSAVAQGTILGPLLFIAFFNDSDDDNDDTRIKIFNFADDKKGAVAIKTLDDTDVLQNMIDKFVNWCRQNKLELNIRKCKVMTFSHKHNNIFRTYTIDGQAIERTNEMRDLRVIMDPKLSFISHIEYTKKKAETVLAFVKRECYKNFDMETAKMLYGALVRSHLEFASVIWSPHQITHRIRVESTQMDAVIYLRGDYKNREENDFVLPPYIDRASDLKLITLVRRRVNASILFIKKVISGQIDSPSLRAQLNLNTGVRTYLNPEFIKLNFFRTDYGLNSPLNYACRAFNHAALFVDPTLPFHEFRNRISNLPDSAFVDLVTLKFNNS